jgi:hypothetical protein
MAGRHRRTRPSTWPVGTIQVTRSPLFGIWQRCEKGKGWFSMTVCDWVRKGGYPSGERPGDGSPPIPAAFRWPSGRQ